MATNNRKNALPVLKDIIKSEVKLDDAQENVAVLCEALERLINQMKTKNPLFEQLFNRIFYTGSYFEGLRVKSATEFDLNVVLVFPFRPADFELLTNCSPPSFAKFHLIATLEDLATRNGWQGIRNIIREFFDSDNYLLPDKIRYWFQGVVDSTLVSLPPIHQVSKIQRSTSGPAITLYITTTNKVQLDVDLVPVIEFKWPNWPLNAKQHYVKQNIQEKDRYWFIVPKPAPAELAGAREKVCRLWRLHFPGIERQLLHDKGCTKSVIKLMKLLRDRQNWKALASYYLKTVVMWSVINDRLDWNESNLDTLFIMMLKKLDAYIVQRKLPYLFYPSFNLLYKLERNTVQADNLHGSLARIIKKFENDAQEFENLLSLTKKMSLQ